MKLYRATICVLVGTLLMSALGGCNTPQAETSASDASTASVASTNSESLATSEEPTNAPTETTSSVSENANSAASEAANNELPDTAPKTESSEDGASSMSLSDKNADLTFDIIPPNNVISVDDLKDMVDAGTPMQLIDIRNVRSFASGHVEGARCIPAGQQIELRSNEINTDGTIVLISTKNDRIAETWQTLVDLGFTAENILVVDGGCVAWEKAGYGFTDRQMMGC